MAKRRKKTIRRKRMPKRRTYRRRAKRVSSNLKNDLVQMGYGAVYGASRKKVSNLVQPISSKLPLGSYSDNAVMGFLAMGLKRIIRNPMVTKLADAALHVEGALIGSEVVEGMNTGTTQTTSGGLW